MAVTPLRDQQARLKRSIQFRVLAEVVESPQRPQVLKRPCPPEIDVLWGLIVESRKRDDVIDMPSIPTVIFPRHSRQKLFLKVPLQIVGGISQQVENVSSSLAAYEDAFSYAVFHETGNLALGRFQPLVSGSSLMCPRSVWVIFYPLSVLFVDSLFVREIILATAIPTLLYAIGPVFLHSQFLA